MDRKALTINPKYIPVITMLPKLNQALSLAVLVLLFSSTQALAMDSQLVASEEGHVEMTPDEASYQSIHAEVQEKIEKLESLGGGMKVIKNYLNQIDQAYNTGNTQSALQQIKSLKRSVTQQLKKVEELRSEKRIVRTQTENPVPLAPAMAPEKEPLTVLLDALSQAKSQSTQVKQVRKSKYKDFDGTPNAYLQMVVKDIVSKELGQIQLPCKGPFRLERFRIAQRISEMQKQRQNISGYLNYYNRTEQIARAARQDPRRIPELSGNVSYLSQQLELKPLTAGSLNVSMYK